MISPVAYADSLRIGTVDFVSPDEIKVMLDIDSPSNVALNAGTPRPFPRVNSYVLIPSERGFLVGQVGWITIERSAYPKRGGMHDFGEIDLPYPLRKMSLSPLGMLRTVKHGKEDKDEGYTFSRGVEVYPTVGDPVVIPTNEQLKSIVESGENRRVSIGVSPLAENAVVSIDPDRLFGRHLAVLGNTGSGKSCSVAGLIRWSIDAAQKHIEEKEKESGDGKAARPNMRFIILDPNGEYSSAFDGMESVHRFAVEADEGEHIEQLQVPLWFWNTEEWCSFTRASGKTQRPTLIQALRMVRDEIPEKDELNKERMRMFLGIMTSIIKLQDRTGKAYGEFKDSVVLFELLKKWETSIIKDPMFSSEQNKALELLSNKIHELVNDSERTKKWATYTFSLSEVRELIELANNTYLEFGGNDHQALPIDADTPRRFDGDDLLRSIELNAELMKTADYVETMLMRIRTLLADTKLKSIITSSEDITLEQWLNRYIQNQESSCSTITIIDMSLVPTEISHIVAAVIARMILEALQRYRKGHNGETLPTTIVMEEAHTFIRRYSDDNEEYTSASTLCTRVFEKIAREGRKFGLGLVLSSQRPSELSPTVLSQCNTFLLHRISNDKDQELVQKLVPDNLRGLLRELPSLPSRNAILLGWASELPVLVQMNFLKKELRPASKDPEYWDTWVGEKECEVDWKKIADEWQEKKE